MEYLSLVQPLRLNQTIGSSYSADPTDVLITKRSLTRLGYYRVPDYGLTRYLDMPMFQGIKRFQQDQGLRVDGVMEPDGPTLRHLGSILNANTLAIRPFGSFALTSGSNSDAPTPEECGYLLYRVDVPTCNAIMARRGKRAAARCFHSAAARYAACLHGIPIRDLPPLDTWNQ